MIFFEKILKLNRIKIYIKTHQIAPFKKKFSGEHAPQHIFIMFIEIIEMISYFLIRNKLTLILYLDSDGYKLSYMIYLCTYYN